MEYIKFFFKYKYDDDISYLKIDRAVAICIMLSFSENIYELNNVINKSEYTIDELSSIIENYSQNTKIKKMSFKKRLMKTLDTKSANEIIQILFQDKTEIDFITLSNNINNLFIE